MLNLKDKGKTWRAAGELSTVGFILVFATLIGYFAGQWIGGKLGSAFWGGLIGLLMGVAAGFIEMFRIALKYIREMEREDQERRKDE